jgi:hypothetical protein
VLGQSGTAMPAFVVVTKPPTQSNGKVVHANATAQRWGQGEAIGVDPVIVMKG